MRIAVLGVGLIGGSIGLAARARVADAEVVGFGRDAERLRRARDLGAVDRVAADLSEALDGADACFCCAPVGPLPDQVAAALGAAGPDCVVSDVGSVKGALAEAFASEERFIGGHPLAGAETAGVEHARADLFAGATWYLTPSAASSGVKFERLHRFLAGLGARPTAIEPAAHDALMAAISHLPHVLANVLVERACAATGSEAPPPIGPSFRDATRVAGANPPMWEQIYAANAPALADQLDATIARLQDVRGRLDSLGDWQAEVLARKQGLAAAAEPRGGSSELRVSVPNQPGIVAQLALSLGRAGVNISDMSLAPSPDQASGLIRFWVAAADADRARALIDAEGLAVS